MKKLNELLDYYRVTWLALGPKYFSLFGLAKRTSNDAESYHSRQKFHFRKRSRVGEWIVRMRELSYREQLVCEGILTGRVEQNKPKERYVEITKNLLKLQDDATDFLNDDFKEGDYGLFFRRYLNDIGQLMGVKAKRARDARKNRNEGESSSGSDSESEEEIALEIEPLVEDKEDEEELLSFIEGKKTKALSPPLKKPRLDSPEVLKEIHVPSPTYPWNDDPTEIREIQEDNNCFYRSIAFLVYKNEGEHERVRKELMQFLLEQANKAGEQCKWIQFFGGADRVEEYGRKYSQLGEWGSSMQLLLSAKLYSKNFVLFQPNDTPRFVPFLVDKNIEIGAMESPVGWIRYQAKHFDVAKFKMKENV